MTQRRDPEERIRGGHSLKILTDGACLHSLVKIINYCACALQALRLLIVIKTSPRECTSLKCTEELVGAQTNKWPKSLFFLILIFKTLYIISSVTSSLFSLNLLRQDLMILLVNYALLKLFTRWEGLS